jgi:hypothetical protein
MSVVRGIIWAVVTPWVYWAVVAPGVHWTVVITPRVHWTIIVGAVWGVIVAGLRAVVSAAIKICDCKSKITCFIVTLTIAGIAVVCVIVKIVTVWKVGSIVVGVRVGVGLRAIDLMGVVKCKKVANVNSRRAYAPSNNWW